MVSLMAVPSYAACVDEVVRLERELVATKQFVGEIALIMNGVGAAAWARRADGTICLDVPAYAGCRPDWGDFIFLPNYYVKMTALRNSVTSGCQGEPNANIQLFRDGVLAELDLNIAKLHAMEDTRD
jgi:hypothetical protein